MNMQTAKIAFCVKSLQAKFITRRASSDVGRFGVLRRDIYNILRENSYE